MMVQLGLTPNLDVNGALTPFHRWGNLGSERLSDLLKAAGLTLMLARSLIAIV